MSENGVYRHHEAFRKQILALLVKPELARKFGSIILPQYFPTVKEVQFARCVHQHRAEYPDEFPTLADILTEMPEEEEFVREVFHIAQNGLHKTRDEVVRYAKGQAARVAFVDSRELYDKGDFTGIVDQFERVLSVGSDLQDMGTNLIGGQNWLHDIEYIESVVTTPWREVNHLTDGGLGAGELGTMIAPSGGYKTTTLVNIGAHAAGIVNAKNVIHISLEMVEWKVLRRYAHRLTFKSPKEEDPDKYWRELHEAARARVAGNVRVKFFPGNTKTVTDIKDFVSRCADAGFEPGLIIIDYQDLLLPRRKYNQRRFELQEIYIDSRALGDYFNCPVWGASQSNRGSFNKRIIRMQDASEDIGKPQNSDVVISVNQTPDEEQNDELRLFMAKIREGGKKGAQIDVKIRYPALISTGFTKIDGEVQDGTTTEVKPNGKEESKKTNGREGI